MMRKNMERKCSERKGNKRNRLKREMYRKEDVYSFAMFLQDIGKQYCSLSYVQLPMERER